MARSKCFQYLCLSRIVNCRGGLSRRHTTTNDGKKEDDGGGAIRATRGMVASAILATTSGRTGSSTSGGRGGARGGTRGDMGYVGGAVRGDSSRGMARGALRYVSGRYIGEDLRTDFGRGFVERRGGERRGGGGDGGRGRVAIITIIRLFGGVKFTPQRGHCVGRVFPVQIQISAPHAVPSLRREKIKPPVSGYVSCLY